MPRLIENADGDLVLLPDAPARIPDGQQMPILMTSPDGKTHRLEYDEAQTLHKLLGQEIARGMRWRGCAPPPANPDDGGTPVAMRMAA